MTRGSAYDIEVKSGIYVCGNLFVIFYNKARQIKSAVSGVISVRHFKIKLYGLPHLAQTFCLKTLEKNTQSDKY